jgi:hypothetical protein
MALTFTDLLGVRVPGSSVFGVPMVFGAGLHELEDATSWLTLACSWVRLRCEHAESRYSAGHTEYLREASLLFQARTTSGGLLPASGRLARGGLVGCGLCSTAGRWTRSAVGAHSCASPPLLPGCVLPRVLVVFPDASAVPPRPRAVSQRLTALRSFAVSLFSEHRALVALDEQLLILAAALTDAYFITEFERLVLEKMGPLSWAHTFHPVWRCRRGCSAGPGEWATHVCPRLAAFSGSTVGCDDNHWDVTGLTLRSWSY